jgi:hypothetical protein
VYPYMNEDAAWQRLKDLQQEMENSRLMASGGWPDVLSTARRLLARVWAIGGLATARAPRRHPRVTSVECEDGESATDAA